MPTLVAWRGRLLANDSDVRTGPGVRHVPALADRWAREVPAPDPTVIAANRRTFDRLQAAVRVGHAAGVRILAGTDCANPWVVPGFGLHEELRLLVKAGLSPGEALAAATIWPAEFLGLHGELGTIAAGKRADLVLLDGNPLSDIGNVARIAAVVLGGELLDRVALDRLLATAVETR